MNTFKIETTQTEKREIEIEFPSFYRLTHSAVIAVISESDIYRCFINDKFCTLTSGTSETMGSELRDTVNAEKITEEEFMLVYNAARKATDLTPHIYSYATSEGITNRITE